MSVQLANNATSKLAAGLSSSATTLAVLPGEGARFPTLGAGDWFPLTIVKPDGTLEIVKCTARSSDTFTIERAQEGTAAEEFQAGDRVELRATKRALEELAQSGGYPSSTEPSVTWPYMTWADTGNGLLKRRNAANTGWEVIGSLFLNAGTDHAGSEPANPIPFMTWADTANGLVKRRSADNASWVVEGELFTYKANRNGDVTQNFRAAPAADTGDVVTLGQAFGVGQSLVGFTIGVQRSVNTVYTNTTGKRITVIVYGAAAGGAEQGILGYIGDTAQYPCASVFRSSVGAVAVSFDVPNGLSYKITASASLDFWIELR